MSSASEIVAEGIRLHRAGDLRAARRCYEQANKKDPFNFDAIHMTGVLALQEGRTDNAIRLIQVAIRIKPGIAEAWMHLSDAYENKKQVDASLTALNKAIDLKPDLFSGRQKRAQMLMLLRRTSEALEDYRYIAGVSEYAIPQNVRAAAHFRMVECMVELGMRDEAIKALNTIDKTYPSCREKVSRLREMLEPDVRPKSSSS